MEETTSLGAISSADTQAVTRMLLNLKVHCLVNKIR